MRKSELNLRIYAYFSVDIRSVISDMFVKAVNNFISK